MTTSVKARIPTAGAVSRLVKDKLNEYVSVKDFGAACDGVTDDSSAIEAALARGGEVVIPAGVTCKITRHIQGVSNTHLLILGTVLTTNRVGGFFWNNCVNVHINGMKVGGFNDPSIQANYVFNNVGPAIHPCIHLRSCVNSSIDGLIFDHVMQGILVSNATATVSGAGDWVLTQSAPTNIKVSNCKMTFCEASGLACYDGEGITFDGNEIYRCGDGGLWFMGCFNSHMINNRRISPKSTPSDIVTYGSSNIFIHPGTWNDEQGIQLENCHVCEVAGNTVRDFWAYGIDIKNSCSQINVHGNFIWDCENAGIISREGDGVKNPVSSISVHHNTFFNVGTKQYNLPTAYGGGICLAEVFSADAHENTFYGWAGVPCISIRGPGGYLHDRYPSNTFQATGSMRGNRAFMKSTFQETAAAIDADANTPTPFVMAGFMDVQIMDNNEVHTDRFVSSDNRINTAAPSHSLTYVTDSATGVFYPQSASVCGNKTSNWIGQGIKIVGNYQQTTSGLVATGNVMSGTTGPGMQFTSTNGAIIGGVVSNVGSDSANAVGVIIEGPGGGNPVRSIVVESLVIMGRQQGGGTTQMSIGLSIDTGADVTLSAVKITGATALTSFTNAAGEIRLVSVTGFPRSNAGSPSGSLFPLFKGEEVFDSTNNKWWKSHAIGSNVAWTQLSN